MDNSGFRPPELFGAQEHDPGCCLANLNDSNR